MCCSGKRHARSKKEARNWRLGTWIMEKMKIIPIPTMWCFEVSRRTSKTCRLRDKVEDHVVVDLSPRGGLTSRKL